MLTAVACLFLLVAMFIRIAKMGSLINETEATAWIALALWTALVWAVAIRIFSG